MKINLNIFCIFFLTLTGTCWRVDTYGQSNCTLKTDKDGIKVWTCDLPNSKFKAVKSSFQVKGTFSQLAAILLDIEQYGRWQYKTLEAKVLEKVSEKEIIYYTEVAAPVLTSNRDFVIRLSMNQDAATHDMSVALISVPDFIPAKENVIRVPFSNAKWNVKKINEQLLQVDYYIEIDLGGSVPPWIVNMVAPQAPYETFKDLRNEIDRYKNKKVAFITD